LTVADGTGVTGVSPGGVLPGGVISAGGCTGMLPMGPSVPGVSPGVVGGVALPSAGGVAGLLLAGGLPGLSVPPPGLSGALSVEVLLSEPQATAIRPELINTRLRAAKDFERSK
jgi:hypothetical protein